jgi:DNA modification methylase
MIGQVHSNAKQDSISLDPSDVLSPTLKRDELYERFKAKISVNAALDRALVSFQANKNVPFSGWFKYREGFSESLVAYLLQTVTTTSGTLLDPFSGAGSALFAASNLGWQTKGIEVLPVGIYATRARFIIDNVTPQELREAIHTIKCLKFADYYDQQYELKHIAITKGAFPLAEESELVGYIAYCQRCIVNENLRHLLLYAAFCILESISYTRKDGQYLRWDVRSGRSQGKKAFNKGYICTFREAIFEKLNQIAFDLEVNPVQQSLFEESNHHSQTDHPQPELYEGSCLDILPTMATNSIDVVLTSPPYANRYDYTRTYALELVYSGCTEAQVKQLRQAMLSCTVENKDKRQKLENLYRSLDRTSEFWVVDDVFQKQEALQEVLTLLENHREHGLLNNVNVVRMIRNYFYEMCFVIYEMARILKPGGTIIMVNDNVRYAGEEIPVDLILSDIAESLGLTTKQIRTLGRGKGNSSQQMGNHGRSELRKCVYVWEK